MALKIFYTISVNFACIYLLVKISKLRKFNFITALSICISYRHICFWIHFLWAQFYSGCKVYTGVISLKVFYICILQTNWQRSHFQRDKVPSHMQMAKIPVPILSHKRWRIIYYQCLKILTPKVFLVAICFISTPLDSQWSAAAQSHPMQVSTNLWRSLLDPIVTNLLCML